MPDPIGDAFVGNALVGGGAPEGPSSTPVAGPAALIQVLITAGDVPHPDPWIPAHETNPAEVWLPVKTVYGVAAVITITAPVAAATVVGVVATVTVTATAGGLAEDNFVGWGVPIR